MKHTLTAATLLLLSVSPSALAASDTPQVDAVRDIVSKYETKFTAPPVPRANGGGSMAVAAPLMGNGDLGVCITGKPEAQVFWVTKNDFWSLKDGSANPRGFGTLQVNIPEFAGASYAARQSLAEAKTITTLTGKESTVTETSFVAATANVLVVTLECKGKPVAVNCAFRPHGDGENLSGEKDGVQWTTRAFTKGVDVPTRAAVAWKSGGSGSPAFTLEPGKPVTLLLTMASNFDAKDPQEKAVSLLKSADPTALETAHRAWWREFYGKSFVEIPDADIMRRYYISQYVLASASRNAKFPPAIIGPWATAAGGWCGYWMNYNHAAPYYGLYSSNHILQAGPQDTPILDFMPVGQKHAQDILGIRGVLYPVGIGPLGLDGGNIVANTKTDNRYEKGITTWGQRSNAAYNLVNMGRRWYTTYDKDYARKIYPFAKAVADFWEDYLTVEDDGHGGKRYAIIGDSVQEGTGKNRNPINSLGVVRSTFKLMLDLSLEYDLEANRRAKWQDILDHLCPFPTKDAGKGKTIFVLSEDMPRFWQSNTVHIQHIYPAGAIGLDSPPEQLAIARDTLAASGRWHDGNGSNSFFPAAARVGWAPESILGELHKYSTTAMAPNGFSQGNIHGIENCSTVPNTINEMLLQSHEGALRFFPVWPKNLDARFGTLRADGAFLVSAQLKSGEISGVTIASEKGRDCTVVNPWPEKKVLVTRNGSAAETVGGERFTLKTVAGGTLSLSPVL
ncbi:MAG: glycoside hydrolase family 95-like protein [Luteolibacter sp.]